MKNCTNNGFTLTCAVGNFTFECDVPMSHAQIVRDTVMAAIRMGVDTSDRRRVSRDPNQIQRWFREDCNGPAKDTQFVWEPA